MDTQPQEPLRPPQSRSKYLLPAIVGLICFAVGYFVGREHVKYELRSAMQDALSGVFKGFPSRTTKAERPNQPDPEVTSYIPLLEVYGITATRTSSSSLFAPEKPMIEGKIKNNGKRTVKAATIRFYYSDQQGNTIFEDTEEENFGFTLLGGETKPLLRPGYVSELFHICKGCPSECRAKPSKMDIVSIEFSD